MSGLIDILRVKREVSEYAKVNVDFNVYTSCEAKNIRFSFSWGDDFSERQNLNHWLSDFEVKMISVDLNDIVIGFFKSNFNYVQ